MTEPLDVGARWNARIRQSENYRRREVIEWNANRYTLLGRNYRHGYLKRGESVNLAWAAFQTMVGTIFSKTPDPIVRETDPEKQLTARMLTSAVAQDLKTMRSRYATRLAMADVFWAGFGLVMEKLCNDITSMAFKFTDYAEDGTKSEKDGLVEIPANQRYSLTRIHPEAVFPDPLGVMPDMSDHMWCAIEYYPTLKELKEDGFYTLKRDEIDALPKLRQAPQVQERVFGRSSQTIDPADAGSDEFIQTRMLEIWDRANREVIYQPYGSSLVAGKRTWPVDLRQNGELLFPWAMLYFNENPDQFWPIPEISLSRPQFEQYSILFRSILADAVGKWRRYLYRSDVVSKAQVDKIRAGGPTELIGIDPNKWVGQTPMADLDQAVKELKDPRVPGDVVAVAQMVKQTVHEIIGAGDFASGGMRNTRSATEAAALSDFMRSRMTNRTENVDAFFQRLVMNHVLFLQQTAINKRRVQVTDELGVPGWSSYDKDDIQGDFAFDVVAGSSMPDNTETRRQENLAFYQQTLPVILQTGGDPRSLIEWIAPFYKIPQHVVDQIYKGHRQALLQAAVLIKKAYLGQQADPTQFMEAVSQAVMTGLSPSELKMVDVQAAAEVAKGPQGAAAAPQAGGSPPAQPGGLPGTNPANQLVS